MATIRFAARAAGRCVTVAALAAGVLDAQTPDSSQFSCEGRVITAIEMNRHPPAIIGRDPSAFRRSIQHILFQSGTTREGPIRSFLLARVGQRCSDRWLPELARVVRAQPYLASVSVRAVSDGADGARLVVETVDEVPLVIGGGYTSHGFSNLKYGNSNIGGTGTSTTGQWREGREAYRDGLSLSMSKYGLFEQPMVATLEAQRDPLGGRFAIGVTRPFLSDLQHIAWYAGGMHSNAYRSFVRPSATPLSLPVKRDIWAGGAVARLLWGSAGLLIGPVATFERSRPNANGVVATDSGLMPADTSILANRYVPYRTFRVGLATGLRWIGYMHVTGFDALQGEQDVARGAQLAATVERGLGAAGATDRSSLLSMDFYSGVGTPRSFVGLALRGEELPAGRGDTWSAAVVSGRLAWYLKPSERRTIEASAEMSGGWRERLPLQLTLGDSRRGLRGYNGSTIAGGRRAVLRLEQRQSVFRTGPFVQWGTAFFTDIGKTWSGDVPYGETTVARASLGVGLLAAVPPKSRRMLRADVAVPVTGGAPKSWVVRVFAVDATRFFWRDPNDIAPVRAGAPASPIFGWR
jgi:hypothetical protein